MSFSRAVAIILLLAVASAGVLAIASRAPARIRLDEPPRDATDPSRAASFTEEQIARHGRYRAPSYLAIALGLVVEVGVLVVLARGPLAAVADRVDRLPGGWPVAAMLVTLTMLGLLFLAGLPLGYVRGFAMQHAWGLSTQDVGGWISDNLRSLLVAAVTAMIAAVAFFGIVRWQPRTWWLWGWLAFTALTALLVFVYPVVIAPLFNRFTPVEDASLATRIRSVAAEAGVAVDQVLVADASRRTTAENAYVAGLGDTKRVVLYDTLLRSGSEDETMFVVAHELGHEAENHLLKNVAIASAGLFAAFALLAWLSRSDGLWSWAGAGGIGDVRALPVLLLLVTVLGTVSLPLSSAISRRFEATADRIAISLTDDPATAVRSFRRLAFANLADLRPPAVAVTLLFTHPPIPQRIRSALEETAAEP